MAYIIENINGCTKKVKFDIDSLDLTDEIKKAIAAKQKTVDIKGFRKGKAPLTVIEKLYRPQIENDALYSFISGQYSMMIQAENLRPVGYPSFSKTKYDPGKSVSFEAIVEIIPDFEVKGVEELSFPKETVKVEESDITKVKESYLGSKSTMEEVKGDSAELTRGRFGVVNFKGKKEGGEYLAKLSGDEVLVETGAGRFLVEFEDGIVGMKKSEKRTVPVHFPADYQDEDLKDAKVQFEIELLEIKEKKFPEWNDEMTKEFGFESVADFNTKVGENLMRQKEKEVKDALFQRILEALIDKNKFDLPTALSLNQLEYLKDDLKKTLMRQGFNDEMVQEYFHKWKDDLSKKADFQVRSGLILEHLARKYNIETTDEDVERKYNEMVTTTGMKMEDIKSFYSSNKEQLKNLFYRVREEKTFDKLLSSIKLA